MVPTTAPAQGTAGWLSGYRVWNRARNANEIRADFDRSFEGDIRPDGLAVLHRRGLEKTSARGEDREDA